MFELLFKAEVDLKTLLILLNSFFHNGKLGLMVWLASLFGYLSNYFSYLVKLLATSVDVERISIDKCHRVQFKSKGQRGLEPSPLLFM